MNSVAVNQRSNVDFDGTSTPSESRGSDEHQSHADEWVLNRRHHGHLWRLADGRGLHAPPGTLVRNPASGAVCCHLCGRWFVALGSHIRVHGYTAPGYRRALQLQKGLPLRAPNFVRAVSQHKKPDHATRPPGGLERHWSDAELATSTGELRTAALAEIYRRHYPAVRRRAERISGHAGADDVAQDVFLSFASRPDRYKPARGSLRSYLLTRAFSQSIDSFRRDRARRDREAAVPVADLDQTDVEIEVLDHLDGAVAKALLAGLPAATRQALSSAYTDGYTYRQVAAILGQPEGTIKARIRQGLVMLRANMAD
jgi:RNA polymerase sigma factor (sigma-70 family)